MPFVAMIAYMLTGGIGPLSSDDFGTRQAQQARLERVGLFAVPLARLGEYSTDVEQAHRCREIIRRATRGVPVAELLLEWQAFGLLHDGDDGFLDARQGQAVKDGGPPLWAAIQYLAAAEGWPPAPCKNAGDVQAYLILLRHFERGLPDPWFKQMPAGKP